MQEVDRHTEGRVKIGAGTLYNLLSIYKVTLIPEGYPINTMEFRYVPSVPRIISQIMGNNIICDIFLINRKGDTSLL